MDAGTKGYASLRTNGAFGKAKVKKKIETREM